MAGLIDYLCNHCKGDKGVACLACGGCGRLRLPGGTILRDVEGEVVVEDEPTTRSFLDEANEAFETWFGIEFGYEASDAPHRADHYRGTFVAGYIANA